MEGWTGRSLASSSVEVLAEDCRDPPKDLVDGGGWDPVTLTKGVGDAGNDKGDDSLKGEVGVPRLEGKESLDSDDTNGLDLDMLLSLVVESEEHRTFGRIIVIEPFGVGMGGVGSGASGMRRDGSAILIWK